MRQNLPNVAVFVVLAVAAVFGTWYVERTFFPPPTPKPPREALLALAGVAVGETAPATGWPQLTRPVPAVAPTAAPGDLARQPASVNAGVPPPAPAAPSKPATLIAMGDDKSFNQAVLTTKGGALQQLKLNRFEEANRMGREVKDPAGAVQNIRVIPGVERPRDKTTLKEDNNGWFPDLTPGPAAAALPPGAYTLLHYPAEDDPLRQPADGVAMNDKYPSAELAERQWDVAENAKVEGGEQRVVFETTLGAPYFLKLRKVFTHSPGHYHLGFHVEIVAQAGREKRKGKFRYQIAGPRGLPVEGEWYAQSYRSVMVGSVNPRGVARRTLDDAATVHTQAGGAMVQRGGDTFTYAAVTTQYFTSALAIDDTQPQAVREGIWDYVRATREPHPWDDPAQLFLADISFRAVSLPLDIAPGETVSHKFLIYNGPMKVRLLKELLNKSGETEADPALVDRYHDALTLRTLTDAPSPNFFGRLANSIYWSDIVIFFTNRMHGVLAFLHRYIPSWGFDIMLLTVMVRLLLLIPSRRQQMAMAKMQEKQARMKPEMDKLAEKFKDNPSLLQQEKAKLMFKHGINPASAMGGCLLLFAQMPIFMGLYFCLQESVFFRQQSFLWFQNLAAPDMTAWWTEQIPYLSEPTSIGGTVYLGPFLNVLPLIAVALIFAQQYLTMPPPTDEQMEMQQRMMKIMVVFMAVFFYKVPSGLCLYFICSTSWALAERKLIKKPTPNFDPPTLDSVPTGKPTPPAPAAPATGFMARARAKLAELQAQADAQAERQIRNKPQEPRGERKKKRKK